MKPIKVIETIRNLENDWGLGTVTTSHIAVRLFGSDRPLARRTLKDMAKLGFLIEIKIKGSKELVWSAS